MVSARHRVAFCLVVALSCHEQGAFDVGLQEFRKGRYEAAVAKWEPLAAKGDARAQLAMGRMYWDGLGLPAADGQEAVNFIRRAAESGYAPACGALAHALLYGKGTARDVDAGVSWLKRAAEAGDPYSALALGEVLIEGRFVTKDCHAASRWVQGAAEQGLPSAEALWGTMLSEGVCVSKDDVAGFRWILRAAEKGVADAQARLSRFYSEGRGTPVDLTKAYMWLRIAVPRAEIALPGISSEDVERAESLAADWKPQRVTPPDYLGWPAGLTEPGIATGATDSGTAR